MNLRSSSSSPLLEAIQTAPRLGLRENWQQFTLLVLINAFVGGMVGLERTVVPLIGELEFGFARTQRTDCRRYDDPGRGYLADGPLANVHVLAHSCHAARARDGDGLSHLISGNQRRRTSPSGVRLQWVCIGSGAISATRSEPCFPVLLQTGSACRQQSMRSPF